MPADVPPPLVVAGEDDCEASPRLPKSIPLGSLGYIYRSHSKHSPHVKQNLTIIGSIKHPAPARGTSISIITAGTPKHT